MKTQEAETRYSCDIARADISGGCERTERIPLQEGRSSHECEAQQNMPPQDLAHHHTAKKMKRVANIPPYAMILSWYSLLLSFLSSLSDNPT